MSHRELFSESLENLNLGLKQTKKISYHYREITKSLNLAFRGTNSRVANRLKVGSVGRHTAIKGISDLDILYIMSPNRYEYYNRKDSGQSVLFTDVKSILAGEYPNQTAKKDRLVVQVIFRSSYVGVQLVFRQDDDSFKFSEDYSGGTRRITKPLHEETATTAFLRDKSNNLRKLCEVIRAQKNLHGISMGDLLIDTLAYRFLSSASDYDNTGSDSPGALAKDFFEYLSSEKRKKRYLALSGNQHVYAKSLWFDRVAKHVHELYCDALDTEGATNGNDHWRKVFGRAFPRRKVGIMETRLGLGSYAADAVPWIDTEEFIEDGHSVDIRYLLNFDYAVTQDGFPPRSLREMLIRRLHLSARKSLLFRANSIEMEVEGPYTIVWKALDVGDEAYRRNMAQGQTVSDGDYYTKKETIDFRGDHMVEYYVIKNEVVAARAQIGAPIS